MSRRFARLLPCMLAPLLVAACVTTHSAPPQLSARAFVDSMAGQTDPAPVTPAGDAASIPKLHGSMSAALSSGPVLHIDELNASGGAELRDVIRMMADKLGLSVSVDPDVHKRVSTHLRNVTLDEALKQLVTDNGYAYTLQDRVLRVVPLRNETRTFSLDYVALSRVGTATSVVQRRFNSGGVSPTISTAPGLSTSSAGASSGIPGGDVISAVQISDLWSEIRVDLDGMLRTASDQPNVGATGTGTTNPAAPTITGNGLGGSSMGGQGGTQAFSASYSDGSQLTISPMAGLITVTARPAKLDEIAQFIERFKASVLRQVLIESKIVEVQLTDSSAFGIDWSLVRSAGGSNFSISSNPAGVTGAGTIGFSLTSGGNTVNAVLNALSSQGNVSVLSSPRVSALNNQRAEFDVTTNEVFFASTSTPVTGANGQTTLATSFQAQQVEIGIVLDVIPQISSDNMLTMLIRPVVTSLVGVDSIVDANGNRIRIPITGQREGDTMIRSRSGETVILGGLTQTQRTTSTSGIPVLQSLPVIGGLFRHTATGTHRVELVFFLTATVISGQPAPGGP